MMSDYIRRDALREARNLAIRAYENANVFNADAIRKRLKPLLDAVVDTPAADVAEVVHARWERVRSNWHCTGCHKGYRITNGAPMASSFSYCPNCGAKMDGGTNNVSD